MTPAEMKSMRAAKGWSQETLAGHAKRLADHDGFPALLKQQSIAKYEAGRTKREPAWMRYVVAALSGATAPVRTEVASAGIIGREISETMFGSKPLPPLPHYGTAVGGEFDELDENVELTELNAYEVMEHLARPASLANDQDAYVITVVGDSMYPRFRPGRRVVVSPRATLSIGDDVIAQLRGREGGEERITMVLIKELVRRTAGFVELKQYNPEMTFRIDQRRVAKLHKILGDYY